MTVYESDEHDEADERYETTMLASHFFFLQGTSRLKCRYSLGGSQQLSTAVRDSYHRILHSSIYICVSTADVHASNEWAITTRWAKGNRGGEEEGYQIEANGTVIHRGHRGSEGLYMYTHIHTYISRSAVHAQ